MTVAGRRGGAGGEPEHQISGVNLVMREEENGRMRSRGERVHNTPSRAEFMSFEERARSMGYNQVKYRFNKKSKSPPFYTKKLV